MEFTKNDLFIFVSLTLFLLLVSFVFPTLGFAGANVSTTAIPEFNVSQGTIAFIQIGEPLEVKRPSEGTLRYEADKEVYEDNRRVWLQGNTDNGYEITLTNNGTQADPNASLFLNEYTNGGFNRSVSTEDSAFAGNFTTLELADYVIAFDNVSYSNTGQSNLTITTDFEVEESPGGQSTFGWIPLIGGGIDAVAQTVSAGLNWIGSIILGVFYNIGATARNVATIVWNIVSFIVGMAWWIIVRYTTIVTAAPTAWASTLLAIPSVVWSYEFAKAMIIIRQQIPVF